MLEKQTKNNNIMIIVSTTKMSKIEEIPVVSVACHVAVLVLFISSHKSMNYLIYKIIVVVDCVRGRY